MIKRNQTIKKILEVAVILAVTLTLIVPSTIGIINIEKGKNLGKNSNFEETYEIKHHMTFSRGDLCFEKRDEFDVITMKDSYSLTNVGKPELPVVAQWIAVPPGMKVHEVNVVKTEKQEIKGEYTICPTQPPIVTDGSDKEITFVEPDAKTYRSNKNYPGKLMNFIHQADLAGQSMASIEFYPLQYNPVQKKLMLYTEITFLITGSGGYECGDYLPRAISEDGRRMYENMVRGMVANPRDVELRFPQSDPQTKSLEPGSYDYVIITQDDWVDDFQPLADWKNEEGIPTTIVTLQDIIAMHGEVTNVSIRMFIQDAYLDWENEQLKYATLLEERGWQIEIVDKAVGNINYLYSTSIALDQQGFPHITYYDKLTDSIMHVYKISSNQWISETVDSGLSLNFYPHPCIAVDPSDNNVRIVYTARSCLNHAVRPSATNDGSHKTWPIEIVDPDGGIASSFAIGGDGRGAISYMEGEDPYDTYNRLICARQDNGGWVLDILDQEPRSGTCSSITMDSNNYPHIGYVTYLNEFLKYAYLTSDGWTYGAPYAIDEGVFGPGMVSIELDDFDQPHIAFRTYVSSQHHLLLFGPDNEPPEPPAKPSGYFLIFTWRWYDYSSDTIDPDGDMVQYGWDWNGDGNVNEWTGFYNSGETVESEHLWIFPGTYYVKVKARDIHGAESDWSESKTVIISKGPIAMKKIPWPGPPP